LLHLLPTARRGTIFFQSTSPRTFTKSWTREGLVSLFTVDRRQSITQELLGVTS
jgi:hypothetical protein